MESFSLLNKRYEQALLAQSPKNFFLSLFNFLEECNNDSSLKDIIKDPKDKTVHFWALSEKTLLNQPITTPAQAFSFGHIIPK